VLQAFANPPNVIQPEQSAILSVLFTRGHDRISELIYWTSGRQYTHASLGLGRQTDCFYSFDYRGFREEHPAHRKILNGQRESLCYQFYVTEEEYTQVENLLNEYKERIEAYRYNTIGAIFSVLRIYLPIKRADRYFCSEFVSEQLKKHSSFRLKRTANMYLPTNLAKVLATQDNLYRILVNEI
jgi:superfamily II helicase